MTNEAKGVTLLGVIATEPDETVTFAIPDGLSAGEIAAAIAAAEEEKARRKLAESERLRELFLKVEQQ
jgi:hypothetical protein